MLNYYAMRHAYKLINKLPLADTAPLDKLVWLYIADAGEDEYSSRGLGEQLNANFNGVAKALKTLLKQGLLLEITPSSGRRPARLKALEPSGV